MASQRSTFRVTRNMHIAEGRYSLERRLGGGAFGELYQGIDTRTKLRVAIKLEKRQAACPQLGHEFRIYRMLHHNVCIPTGIPRVFYYGTEAGFNALVMDLCGPSLEDLFNYCGRKLSLKTVCMLADQMLRRVEFIHEKGFLHRDMKPENFLFGIGKKGHILYLVDYGLSKLYWDKRKKLHIPFCEGKPLIGTARYCSVWTHQGYEQSRRDDLEAISFILVYLLIGSLPWQGVTVKDQQLKTILIGEKKLKTPLEDLCGGLPEEILQYCKYCRNLKFTDQPQYARLRELFYTLAKRHDYLHHPGNSLVVKCNETTTDDGCEQQQQQETQRAEYDWMFDWFVKRNAEVASGRGAKSPSLSELSRHQYYNKQQQQQKQRQKQKQSKKEEEEKQQQQQQEEQQQQQQPKEEGGKEKRGGEKEKEEKELEPERQSSYRVLTHVASQLSKTCTELSNSEFSIHVLLLND